MAQRSYVCIDIGSYHLKVALFTKQGKKLTLVKTSMEKANLPPGDSFKEAIPSVVAALDTLLNTMNIKRKSTAFYISLPGQFTFCRLLRLPIVDRSKIHQMVQYEAQQQVPFSLDEVIWDYQVLGNPDPEHLHVLLTAIRQEWGEELLRQLKEHDIQVELIEASPIASFHSLCKIYPQPQEPIALINIGHRATNLMIYAPHTVWIRTIPIGGEDFTKEIQKETKLEPLEAESIKHAQGTLESAPSESLPIEQKLKGAIENTAKRLGTELSRSLGFYNTQFSASKISSAYLTGGGSQIPNLENYLSKKILLKVSLLNPFEGLPCDRAPDEPVFLLSEIAGLALRAEKEITSPINLLPKSYISEHILAKKKEYFLYSAFTILLILIVQIVYQRELTKIRRSKLSNMLKTSQELKAHAQEIKNAMDQAQNFSLEITEIEKMAEEKIFWANLFQELGKVTPPKIWLTKLTTSYLQEANQHPTQRSRGSPPGTILLTLYCRTTGIYKDVSDFRETLAKLPFFQTVQIRSANPPVQDIRDFVIQAEVKE